MNKSYAFYTVRFTVTMAFSVAILIALLAAAETIWPAFFQDLAGPALGAIIGGTIGALTIPVTLAGKRFYTEETRPARFAEGFILSLLFAIGLCIACVAVVMGANILLQGQPFAGADLDALLADTATLTLVLGAAFVLILVMIWPLFIAGIKGEIKRVAKSG